MVAIPGCKTTLSHSRHEQRAPICIYPLFTLHRAILNLKKSLRLCLLSVSITSCENAHKGFFICDGLLVPPTQCLLHADYKVLKTMPLKFIISRGHSMSLGENEKLHSRGCFPDRGWILLFWGCRVG